MSLSTLLVNTCTITPRTEGQSATSAGLTFTDGTAVTGVACNVQQTGGSEFVTAGREDGERQFVIYFPASTTVALSSKISSITGSSIAGLSGAVLEVTSPPQDHSGRGTYVMVTAREVQG